jgi:hypothetical protein
MSRLRGLLGADERCPWRLDRPVTDDGAMGVAVSRNGNVPAVCVSIDRFL